MEEKTQQKLEAGFKVNHSLIKEIMKTFFVTV